MSEAAAHLDEVYENARKNCNKETVDSLLARLHALIYESEYDTTLTTKHNLIPDEPRDTLFSDEQREQMLEVLTLGEVTRMDNKYKKACTRLTMRIAHANNLCVDANRRAGFISRVRSALVSMQCLVADTEIVVTRLEQEIESLELALTYDQERECY